MRALILAAGKDEKWGNYLGVPKHLIPIKGEPLIHRTQRQLYERGVEDIVVVSQWVDKDAYVAMPYGRWEPPHAVARDWIQEMEPSRHLWYDLGRTMILYGDCYFTDALMDAMCSDIGVPWHAYARWGASTITGKGYGEMFGWVFRPQDHALLDAGRAEAIRYVDEGLWWRALGWEVYRNACGMDITKHAKEERHAVDWSDESDDFDVPHEWDRWAELHPELAY